MKVAYLTNQYPTVSHTFIRREILALEELGLEILRFSLRAPPDDLKNASDQEEHSKTQVILAAGAVGLAAAGFRQALRQPVRFLRAMRLAIQTGWRSERGVLINLVYLAEACVLRESIRNEAVDHLHVHFGTNPATVAMLCHALGGPEYSFTSHGPEEYDKPHNIALREKIDRARFVVAISSFGRSQLYRHCPHSQWAKISIVRCGVDHSFLQSGPTRLPEARRLVCVGRLSEQKGQLLLIEAAAQLRREGQTFELILVGDGEMRDELEMLIAQHGLEQTVTITGWASEHEVRAALEGARALVLPSFAEGLPVVIMEALALGRPVISTYVAGIPELVEHERCGWLVPAGSVEDLAIAMREAILASPEQLDAMGQEGKRRVAANHDVRTNAAILKALFERQNSDIRQDWVADKELQAVSGHRG